MGSKNLARLGPVSEVYHSPDISKVLLLIECALENFQSLIFRDVGV